MDIDAVYTWVNHQDPLWQKDYATACQASNETDSKHATANTLARFQNRNELMYSIRSVKKYAPWIRRIHVVTNCALPQELATDSHVRRISHESIFPDPSVLPVFNSRAIESNLHLIDGLSENFLYFNDDFFLCRPVSPTDFFLENEKVCIFPSRHDMPYDKAEPLSPFDHGALNACRLIYEETGYKPEKKLHHAPYPLSRRTLFEIEEKYSELVSATRARKFRHEADLPLATSMHAYYAYTHDRGEFRDIKCRYIDIGDPLFIFLIHPLSPLRRGYYTTCCINEVTNLRLFPRFRDLLVQRLMQKMFSD